MLNVLKPDLLLAVNVYEYAQICANIRTSDTKSSAWYID